MPDQRALLSERLERAQLALDGLVASVRELPDEQVMEPSALPGWTRGHVLTHVARNADGMANLALWAITGEPTPMYPSRESRDADIEAGAKRCAADLAADLTESGDRFAGAWTGVTALDDAGLRAALGRAMHLGAPSPHSPAITGVTAPLARRREIEIHRVDLGLPGYTADDWPADFAIELIDTVAPTRSSDDGLGGVARLVDDAGAAWQLRPGTDTTGGLTLQGPTWLLATWLIGRPVDTSALLAIDEHGTTRQAPEPPAWT